MPVMGSSRICPPPPTMAVSSRRSPGFGSSPRRAPISCASPTGSMTPARPGTSGPPSAITRASGNAVPWLAASTPMSMTGKSSFCSSSALATANIVSCGLVTATSGSAVTCARTSS